jgi:glycosyltransferase involved in cell wall biosynthesis
LTEKGFSVDVIDRNCSDWSPNKSYDLFLGLGVGNSGKNFVRYAMASKAPIRVLLSMGPQPDVSNALVLERYKEFHRRTGTYAPPMRTVQDVIGEKFDEIIRTATHIFNIGEKGNRSYNSYLKYGRPVIHFYPAVSPAVKFKSEWLSSRRRNTFLCFAGNGLICKGVDIVLESFLKDQTKNLHICGPQESSFFSYYRDTLKGSSNIKYHGFIEPGGDKFETLASECSYVVFHSSAEGCCTSVATAMRAGLVPIVNPWTGINVDDEGYVMSERGDLVEIVSSTVSMASSCDPDLYSKKVDLTLKKSNLFTQESYTKSYSEALDEVLK